MFGSRRTGLFITMDGANFEMINVPAHFQDKEVSHSRSLSKSRHSLSTQNCKVQRSPMREDADVIEHSQAAPLRNSCNLIGAQPASCSAECRLQQHMYVSTYERPARMDWFLTSIMCWYLFIISCRCNSYFILFLWLYAEMERVSIFYVIWELLASLVVVSMQ